MANSLHNRVICAVTHFIIIRQMAPLSSSNVAGKFGVLSGLALAMQYHATAAVWLLYKIVVSAEFALCFVFRDRLLFTEAFLVISSVRYYHIICFIRVNKKWVK